MTVPLTLLVLTLPLMLLGARRAVRNARALRAAGAIAGLGSLLLARIRVEERALGMR